MAKKNTSGSALARRAWVAIKTRALSMFNHKHSDNRMYYGDHHQLSFDETPSFRFGFHLQKTSSRSLSSCFPCIKPVASFNSGLEQDEHGIDVKAEEFIAQFYEQMKLQRQASLSLAA